VAAITFGIVGYLMHPRVAEAPSALSPGEAVALLADHDRLFVTVTAGAETERRIYSTVCNRPLFGRRSPSRVYDLSQPEAPGPEELASYLGAVVSIKGGLGPQEIAVQVVASGAGSDDKVSGERILAPVAGSGDALFVGPFDESEDLPSWVASGPIQGLMWVWDSDDQASAELEAVLGHPLPARYGVIHHDETAADHNRKTTFGLRLFTGFGGVLLVVSVIAFFVRRRRAGA
jgi:hypothetical protein